MHFVVDRTVNVVDRIEFAADRAGNVVDRIIFAVDRQSKFPVIFGGAEPLF